MSATRSATLRVVVEPGVRTGRAGADRQPARGRHRPHRELARRHALFGGPAIVVDFGTATTFDAVIGQGGVPRRRHRARHRDLAGRAGRRGPSCARSSSLRPLGDRQEHRRGAAVRAPLRLRRPGRRRGEPDGSRAADDPDKVTVVATGGLAPMVLERGRSLARTSRGSRCSGSPGVDARPSVRVIPRGIVGLLSSPKDPASPSRPCSPPPCQRRHLRRPGRRWQQRQRNGMQ